MSEGAFWFIIAMLAGGFVVYGITHIWGRMKPDPDEEAMASHRQLMKELRKHK